MKLVYAEGGAAAPQNFDLAAGRRVVLGRSSKDCDVVLRFRKKPEDPAGEEDREASLVISRRHLEVWLEGQQPMIVSHNAAGITFVDSEPLKEESPRPLQNGLVVKIAVAPGGAWLSLQVSIANGEVHLTREGVRPASSPAVELDSDDRRSLEVASRSLETSVMVIMFTDQVGSTQMAGDLGERAFHKLRRERDRLQTEVIARETAGQVIKSTGDGLLSVFRAPKTALERAVELQRAIAARNRGRPEREQIRMRIGLDMGQVVIDRNINYDVFGMRVNVAARVMDRADGGQILLTQSIHDAVVGWLSDVDFRLVAVGKARLKGVADPIQIYRVAYDEPVDADAPASDRP